MRQVSLVLLLITSLALAGCTTATPPAAPAANNTTATASNAIPAGHFYFSADNCVACTSVAAYVNENAVRQRLYYIDRKIDSSGSNVELLRNIAARCGIAEKDLSVPLFWDGAKCYHGSDEVIGYFENTLK